jgi:hypothetical protein
MRLIRLVSFAAVTAFLAYSDRTLAQAPDPVKAPASGQERRPFKLDVTAETFAKLHALIRPHENEWRHLKVHWQTDVVAARKKAAAEDKPIIICYTGGAGYNEPLGVC